MNLLAATLLTITLAGGDLTCEAPAEWESVTPRINMIEKEFSIAPPAGSDAKAARLTISTAGGSIDANIARWIGQFRGTEGGADRSAADIDRDEADGMKVTFVDLSGVFLESSRGPFGPKTPREGYRMLGAIVETGGLRSGRGGNYFFKLVGPDETVEPAAEGFRAMVLSLDKK